MDLSSDLIGKVVRVTLFDHCKNSKDLVVARVYGEVVDVAPARIVLRAWCDELTDKDATDTDDCYAIVGTAIIRIDVLGDSNESNKEMP